MQFIAEIDHGDVVGFNELDDRVAAGEAENDYDIFYARDDTGVGIARTVLAQRELMQQLGIKLQFNPQGDGTAELTIYTGKQQRHKVWLLLTPDGIYGANGEEV